MNNVNTVSEFLSKNNLKLSEEFVKDIDERIHNKNKFYMKYLLPCNHEKHIKISSMASSRFDPFNCLVCKREKKNTQIDYKKLTVTCPKCEIFYRITNDKIYSNIHAFKCHNCADEEREEGKKKPEAKFYRNFYKDFNLYKSFKYPNSQCTADFFIYKKDEVYEEDEENHSKINLIIEIDDASHNSKKGKRNHEYKDTSATNLKFKVLRIHRETLDSFIDEGKAIINDIIENHEPGIHYYKGGNDKEKIFSKSFYGGFSKTREKH